tara:strand:+ start:477 stop:623 length:147 start_codon:yes stop_codon:yes gene_type:complete
MRDTVKQSLAEAKERNLDRAQKILLERWQDDKQIYRLDVTEDLKKLTY